MTADDDEHGAFEVPPVFKPGRKPMANIPPFGLRMQPELKERIERAAKENNRSLNSEIVQRLQDSLDRDAQDAAYIESYQPPTDAEMEAQSRDYQRWLDERDGRSDEEFPPGDAIINAPDDFVPPLSRKRRDAILKKLDLSDPEVAAAIVSAMKEAVAETVQSLQENAVSIHVQDDDE